jgi:hypothetical protein
VYLGLGREKEREEEMPPPNKTNLIRMKSPHVALSLAWKHESTPHHRASPIAGYIHNVVLKPFQSRLKASILNVCAEPFEYGNI